MMMTDWCLARSMAVLVRSRVEVNLAVGVTTAAAEAGTAVGVGRRPQRTFLVCVLNAAAATADWLVNGPLDGRARELESRTLRSV